MIAIPGADSVPHRTPTVRFPGLVAGDIIYVLCKSQNIFSCIHLEVKELESSINF